MREVPSTFAGLEGFQANTKTYAELGSSHHTPQQCQEWDTAEAEKQAGRQGWLKFVYTLLTPCSLCQLFLLSLEGYLGPGDPAADLS